MTQNTSKDPSPKKKKNGQPFFYPIIFMIFLSAILTFILAYLNQTTYAVIKDQEDLAVQKSILYAMDVKYTSDEEVKQIMETSVEDKKSGEYHYYTYQENGDITKYAFPIEGKALWGSVEAFGGMDSQIKTLLGVDFVKHSETPGLGGRISEEWYKSQFRGVDISGQPPYVIYKPASGGNIDAITGATLTSNSVRDMVNDSIDTFKKEVKEGSK